MENISNLIVTAVSIIGATTAAIIAGLTIWTFRDIRSRSRDLLVQILATVMVAVIPVAGILVYFMLRPRETLAESYVRALEEESLLASIEHQEFCPTCGRRVDPDMVFCPACHSKLRNPCPNCHRAVHLSWDMCPYCGVTLQPEMPVAGKVKPRRVSAPPTHPVTPLPSSTPQPTNTLPAGPTGSATSNFVNVLDRVGGVIEGLVDRISSRNGGDTPAGDLSPKRPEPPPQQTTQAYPRNASSGAHAGSAAHASSAANGNGNNSNSSAGNGSGSGSGSVIKPLISREEPLE
jgi:hypothetical protein